MLELLDPNDIQNLEQARQAIIEVLNLVEELVAENRKQREEIQRLRDVNNRLKGEHGKAQVKPSRKPPGTTPSDHSSEQGDVIQLKVALSYCSVAQAPLNLESEL